MIDDDNDLQQVLKNWNLVALPGPLDRSHVIDALAAQVAEKLLTNRTKFLNDLYRLDVSEVKLAQVFRQLSAAEHPRKIAELILERELQKAVTRRKYKSPEEPT